MRRTAEKARKAAEIPAKRAAEAEPRIAARYTLISKSLASNVGIVPDGFRIPTRRVIAGTSAESSLDN